MATCLYKTITSSFRLLFGSPYILNCHFSPIILAKTTRVDSGPVFKDFITEYIICFLANLINSLTAFGKKVLYLRLLKISCTLIIIVPHKPF